ncbi:biotin transporter BioY [Bacillus sp. 2205SS5-2]|uniref:biotin transporter BioY n=1 Tax=Bacillus sp. 2205SS5-2 TaxID=3109031 RepID=UPI003006E753
MKEKTPFKPIDLTLAALFVAMTAIGANITTIAPFMQIGSVPITLQTFFAILAGLVLGKRLGSIAMLVYLLVGLVGVPAFAGLTGGFVAITKPTFGFILSFIPAAYVAGLIVENRKNITFYMLAALIGTALNYIIGTTWMYFAFLFWAGAPEGFTYIIAWSWMTPFMPKDIILAIFAGVFATRLQASVLSRSRFQRHSPAGQ